MKRTNFFILGALTGLTTLSGAILSAPFVVATTTVTPDCVDDENRRCSFQLDAAVVVSPTCSISGNTTEHSETVTPGNSKTVTGITIEVLCNDPNGFKVYAVGYTNDTYGTTVLKYNGSGNNDIATGTSGTSSSWWAMQVSATDTSIITSAYSNSEVKSIPSTSDAIISSSSATGITTGNGKTFTINYPVYIKSSQPAGTYTGQVKYTLVNPQNGTVPTS